MRVKKESHVVSKTGAERSDTKGKGRYDCILLGFPHMLFRLARLFEQGIESGYAPGNWKKGTDLRRWLEGGCRHLSQFAEGLVDEDHLIAGIWNLLCLGETRHLIEIGTLPTELDNLPFTPKPGDRRINPETGQEEVFIKGTPIVYDPTLDVDPASPEDDESVVHVMTPRIDPNVEYVNGPPPPSVKELQTRVDEGELLSDRENNILHSADCGRSHPFINHTVAGPIPCTCDACQKAIEPPTFYICGPMTGMKDFNFPLFDQVTALARSQGLSVINPAELDREHGIDPSVDPNSVERARRADPNLIQTIVQRDTQVIVGLERDKGDGLILLPGWENSTGGRAEIAIAIWMGLEFKLAITTWHGQDCKLDIMDTHSNWVETQLFHQGFNKKG